MLYKTTKPGLVSILYLSIRYTVLLFIRAPFYVWLFFVAMCSIFWLFWLSYQYQWRNYGRQWRQPPQGASPEGAPRDRCQKNYLTPHRLTMQCNHVVTINKILNFAENNVNNVDMKFRLLHISTMPILHSV